MVKVPQGRPFIRSIDSVRSPFGDVDLIEGTGMTITPDDANNQITFTADGLWTLVQSFSNSNTSTNIDFDTGVLGTTYDMYRIIGILENTSGAYNLWCQINGLGTSDYDYVYYDGGGTSSSVNNALWRLAYGNVAGPMLFDYLIIGNYEVAPANQFIQIIGDTGAGDYQALTGAERTLWGEYTANVSQVNRIRVWTSATEDTTGRMHVYGFNF
jgi:hypothetical protein